MAVRTPTELKSFFEQGDFPTESQFGDLIDSVTSGGNFLPYIGAISNTDTGAYTFKTAELFSPLITGGSGTTQSIIYKTTSGVGITGADHIFQVGNNGGTEALRILNNADIGIGITPLFKLHISDTKTTDTDYSTAYQLSIITPSTGISEINGKYIQINVAGSQAVTSIKGIHANARWDNTNTITTIYGIQSEIRNLNTGTVTNAIGLNIPVMFNSGGGTITNAYGIVVAAQTVGSTLSAAIYTNNGEALGRYNLYINGAAQNYIAGNIGLGILSTTAALHIKAGSATAGTAPLKLTAGTNLTTPENGAIEFDGTNIYITVGGVRKTFTIV